MSLAIAYRPDSFDEFYGNDRMIEALRSILARPPESMRHSFLFTGQPGTGKTTIGRCIANELGVTEAERHEYDTANTRGIGTIRDIIEQAQHYPTSGPFRFYLLDEVHKVTTDGLNALLKTLEEPPKHSIFVLCTAEFDVIAPKLQQTLKRRCEHFELNTMSPATMEELIEGIVDAEEKTIDSKVVSKIVSSSNGSIGQALSFLDTVIDVPGPEDAIGLIESTVFNEKTIFEIMRAITDPTVINPWSKMRAALVNFTGDAESARRAILTHIERTVLRKEDISKSMYLLRIMGLFNEPFMYSGKSGLVAACALASYYLSDVPF